MSHYYSKNQDSVLRLFEIDVNILGNSFTVQNAGGVFSSKKLDRGSEVLIMYAKIKDGWKVLDIGCGCGIVGIALSKAYDINLTMSDVNKRAVKMARMNAKKLGVDAEIINSDRFEKIDDKFDTILLNPPQSAGKDVCIELITGAKKHLNEGGSLQIVARHNKGGKALSEVMEEIYGDVEVLARKSGFRVYMSILKNNT